MPITQKGFSGIMNLDDNNDVIPQSHHKEAKNISFRGNGVNQIAQNVVGNTLINNSGAFSLPAGTNSCIGSYYDQLNARLFYLNYNSNGNNGIYIYNTVSGVIQTLFLSNTHSATDILNFDINVPITSINIIYADTYSSTLDTEGDVLYWVDSLKRPSKLNISRKLQSIYSLYKRSYLDVAKAPPVMPIKCTYENDIVSSATTTLSTTLTPQNYTASSLLSFTTSSHTGFILSGTDTFTANTVYTYTGTLSFPINITVNAINPILNTFKISLRKNGISIATITYTVGSTPYSISTTLSATTSISTGDAFDVSVQADANFNALTSGTSSITGTVATSVVKNNNLKNSLFQFIYRWVYDDNEKSVWSTGSQVPLPYMPNDQDNVANPEKNSRINIFFSTGDETVKRIELAVRRSSDGITSDYALITSLDKNDTVFPIADNTISNYLFYNSSTATPIDQTEAILLYDYVPLEARTQELLNGDTLIYGGIKEGYNLIKNNKVSLNLPANSSGILNIPGTLFFAYQNGVTSYGTSNSISVLLTGAGTNDVSNTPTEVTSVIGSKLVINLINASNDPVQISYSNTLYTNIASVLAGIASVASGLGYTTSISGNILTITSSTAIKLASSYAYTEIASATSPYSYSPFNASYKKSVLFSNYSTSNYKYGLVYYDEKGRTNGAVTNDGLKTTTSSWASDTVYPDVRVSVDGTPPDWAYYYHIVRTDTLTYNKNLFWVSNRAFTNFTTLSSSPDQFAISYIGINNMSFYNEQIQSTSGYISYDYAAGDRIKFLRRISSTGTLTSLPSGLDFEIIGTESDPNINGYIAKGTYIKIKYPISFISADFQLYEADPVIYASGSTRVENFQNYEIQIYSYKQVSDKNEVYYEIGHQYAIGNPGNINPALRYHIGLQTSQGIGSTTADTWMYSTGDGFYRFRNIPTGASYSFAAGPYTQNDGSLGQFCTTVINVWDSANNPQTISTTNYEIKSQVTPASTCGLAAALYPNNATTDYLFYNKSDSTMTISVKGILKASTITSKNQYVVLHAKIVNASGATIQTIIQRGTISTTNDEYSFPFDAKIKVPTLSRVFLITECSPTGSNSLLVGAFNIELNIVQNAEIAIIESSFSDVYKLELNSDSRPVIYDENAKNAYYPTLVRYSLPKNVGTTTNQSNRFYYSNMDEYDRQKGEIQRLKVRGNQMRVFQARGCGVASILENMIFNADGGENLIQTSKIINKIHYYQGEYGMGGLTTSLASSAGADYFVDPIRGYQLRVSQDGITAISELYKAQYYITNLANKYVTAVNGTLGGKAKVLGFYDFYEEEYVAVFQGYTGQPNTTLAFSELKNCYTSFYDYAPEWVTSVEGRTISFRSGQLWVHNNTSNYNTFFGTYYPSSLTLVFNTNPTVKKDFNSISQDATSLWTSATMSDINTSLGQSSNLVSGDYELNEGFYHAAFMRDSNSIGGVIEGDYLKGNWLQSKFSNSSANFVYLSGVYMNFTISQRNG